MTDFDLTHFFATLDPIGRFVLIALLGMSLASWTVILFKLVQLRRAAHQRSLFLGTYRSTTTPANLRANLEQERDDGYARIARSGFQALGRWRGRNDRRLLDASDSAEFVSIRLALAVTREREWLENGLVVLATVGSTAPFVGLLGTVWGIYRALVAIGANGQGTLDKLAGPVGEALIMTAIGLSVAIPAVLAYNTYLRTLQHTAGHLENFAHELFGFMTTGLHSTSQPQSNNLDREAAPAGTH